jgi:hypothetical protein
LSDDFVSVKAEDKLWFGSNAIMPGDFGGKVGVDLNNFKEAVFAGQFRDVQICGLALWIPVGAEVDEQMGVFVSEEMGVQLFKAGKAAQV